MQLTAKQLSMLLDVMAVRIHNRYAADAALHDKKLKTKELQREVNELNEDQKQLMDKAIKAASARILKEKMDVNAKNHSQA